MPVCPNCAANAIGWFAKFWSDSASPARCSACGGLAYLPARETAVLNAIVFPGSILVLAIVVLTNSFLPLFSLAMLLIAAFVLVVSRGSMVPLSEAQAASNRRWGNGVLVASVLIAVIWWWLSHA